MAQLLTQLIPVFTAFASQKPATGEPVPEYLRGESEKRRDDYYDDMSYGEPTNGETRIPEMDSKEYTPGDMEFGEPDSPPANAYGDPATGGITDWVVRQLNNLKRSLGVSTTKMVNSVRRDVKTNRGIIRGVQRRLEQNRRELYKLRKGLAAKHQEQSKNKWLQAALSAAQSIPGIYASNILHSDEFKKVVLSENAFAKAVSEVNVGNDTTAATVNAVPAAFDQVALQTIISQIVTNQDTIIAQQNVIKAALNGLTDEGGDTKEAYDELEKILEENVIQQLAELVPSQLDDTQKAMYESLMKIIIPGFSGSGGGFELKLG